MRELRVCGVCMWCVRCVRAAGMVVTAKTKCISAVKKSYGDQRRYAHNRYYGQWRCKNDKYWQSIKIISANVSGGGGGVEKGARD